MDRTTRTVLPDNTVTTMVYGFGGDRDGLTQFQPVVTDANGMRKVSYRDVQEQITAVQEFNQNTVWCISPKAVRESAGMVDGISTC